MANKGMYASAREMAGCSEECIVTLDNKGVEDHMHHFVITHNTSTIDVMIGVGTTVGEMYKALGRGLQEIAGHATA